MEKLSEEQEISRADYMDLLARLQEAEDTLQAIRSGEVDALVVSGTEGQQVYTLKDADRPYRVMLEEMNEGAITLTERGVILYCNNRFAEMVGMPLEAVLGQRLESFIAESQRPELKQIFREARKEGTRAEILLKSPTQEIIAAISIRGMNLDGNIRLVALFSDMTELRSAETTILRQADEYQSLLATSNDGFLLMDEIGMLLDVNPAYCRLSEFSREEILSKNIQDLEAIETPDEVGKHIRKVIKKGYDRFETCHRRKSGELVDVEVSTTWLKNSRQIILFIHDIRERKKRIQKLEDYRMHLEEMVQEQTVQVEEEISERLKVVDELEKSEKRYRELVKFAPTGIYEVDFRTGKFTSVNDTMCEILGYTREELLSMTAMDFLDPESQARFKLRIQEFMAGKEPEKNVEYKVLTRDGRVIYAILSVNFSHDEEGKPLGAMVIAHDITERKKMEDEVQQSVKKLKASNAELKWLNDTMVNREVRMVELKREINDLCRRLGEAERYP